MRNYFDAQLEKLNQELVEMGAMIERALDNAIQALMKQNLELAHQNIEDDKDVDQKMKDVETLCLRLLLSQQPVARDLRSISSAMKMVSDLERIGDQCADISEIILSFSALEQPFILDILQKMSAVTRKMVSESVEAFVHNDVELSRKVCIMDDQVDELFVLARDALIEKIRKGEQNGEMIVDLIMIAKYFERIGDHAVNVSKWVIFSVTGTRNGCNYMGRDDKQ